MIYRINTNKREINLWAPDPKEAMRKSIPYCGPNETINMIAETEKNYSVRQNPNKFDNGQVIVYSKESGFLF